MVNLTKASRELFSRTPDERFDSFDRCSLIAKNGKLTVNRALAAFAEPSHRARRQVGLLMRLEASGGRHVCR